MKKNYKILLSKPGLDGHDVGVKVLAHALVENGFEVVYTGLRKSVEDIVSMAISNNVDCVGLSILSGTHIVISQNFIKELKKNDLNLPWIVGGNIPDKDVDELLDIGATSVFPSGSTMTDVVAYFDTLAQKS
ncbi:MAG: methylmalonyl-CoA mutase [Proteobacteria bacterium]|nr:methylmalonyl-CoA mutase [Pseudomonadota bacterium]